MDTKILDNDKSNVKDKSNFLKTDDIVVVERYNQLGKKKKIKWWKRLQKKKEKKERSEGPNRNRDRLDGKWHWKKAWIKLKIYMSK